ncbi:hypothetical protein [Acidovorax sp. FG27]|uniref:hypothetical protein n=1 Tax=Acidovorax sp. FG27 TaxID=3133652 RepID=UPI0030E8BF06
MKSMLSVLLPVVCSFVLSGCSGPSKEDLAAAKEECKGFYKRERAKYSAIVEPVDHWTKDGAIVIELADKASEYATSYTAHLCIYDKEKGTISLPGALYQGRWMK